jgi:hypothetical protein
MYRDLCDYCLLTFPMTMIGTLQIYTLIVVTRERAGLGGFRSEVK